MKRKWPVPSKKRLLADIGKWNTGDHREKIERLRFIHRHFGDPDELGMWLVGGIVAAFSVKEMFSSFLNGNDIATVLVCQVFAEHQLAGTYVMAGKHQLVGRGFKALIEGTVADRYIGKAAGDKLQKLRQMRNPYTHHRLLDDPNGLMPKIMKAGGDPYKMSKMDAMRALEIIAELLRDNSPDWGPPRRTKRPK